MKYQFKSNVQQLAALQTCSCRLQLTSCETERDGDAAKIELKIEFLKLINYYLVIYLVINRYFIKSLSIYLQMYETNI